ncbi:PREDICTED: protein phosphatase 1 regulatory subunit 15A [Gekko japonicus]|uniref:Protein phosphatase 1 regulatory subunit 15A n=1 Tax=Gekko japonicus TaxID=146911 RepID=A0ABM1KK10_GEKJA|nr:PREDICTED: protein phosphatase 1 regulatory subunit 15A [Gekko japonicus]
MPPQLPSELALEPKSINGPSVGCDQFGLRMTKRLPLESSRSPPAGNLDTTAMLLRRVANLPMCWLKKWFHLWQNFSGALMKAILMGIAKGACRLAAAAPLEKIKRPFGGKEDLGRDKSKLDDGEKLNGRVNPQGYLILSSLESWSQEAVESLFEDGHFGECSEQFFSGAKMDKMDSEDTPALCLIHHSISFDFENDSESSSDEDMGLEDAECPGGFPQDSLEGLGYFEDSCSSHEEFGDFENDPEEDSRESVESPWLSQERMESVQHNGDFVMFEEQSVESTSDAPEDGEYLSQYGKAKENLGTPTISCGFKSPLVLSLFYSPSEEEDDDDDSEDWSSEDEMEETGQSCLDGAVSENGDRSSSAAEDVSRRQDFPQSFCGSGFPNMDPFHSLCVSKPIQPSTFVPSEPKKHKEVTVSFHLRKPDSKPEEFGRPPKPSSPKDRGSAPEHPTHQSCQLETERNRDLVTTETSFSSQKGSQMVKKVRFSPEVTVRTLVVWDFASRAARRGPWEEMARDRCRFQRRIAEVGAVLEPCLGTEHRARAWRKIHRALDLVQQEDADDTLNGSAGREKPSV